MSLGSYIRQDAPKLTGRAIKGFNEDELELREKNIEKLDLLSISTGPTLVYYYIVKPNLQRLYTRKDEGKYISLDVESLILQIQLDYADESPLWETDHNSLVDTIQYGLDVLRKENIVLDYYLGCESNKDPDNWIIFLT